MTFLIAAAGTGGHVYPGLSVAEALIRLDVPKQDIMFVGGSRLESKIYPDHGFSFLELELRGLKRTFSLKNLSLPGIVARAKSRIEESITDFGVASVLGMGGYVTIPTAIAARRSKTPFFTSEQNADAGLANRLSSRWANKSFGAFPTTRGMPGAVWVGNPVREPFWEFERGPLRDTAIARYGLDSTVPTLGIFGGSLGAGAINTAVVELATGWTGPEIQVVHLTGERNFESMDSFEVDGSVRWHRISYEESMPHFYAVSDLVVARAGGAVAELTATGTPSILVPGVFGSAGHQQANAGFLTQSGAAVTLEESELGSLGRVVQEILFNKDRLASLRDASTLIAKPGAALAIAESMIEAA